MREHTVECEKCGAMLLARKKDAGKTATCPDCKAEVYIPSELTLLQTVEAGRPPELVKVGAVPTVSTSVPPPLPSTPRAQDSSDGLIIAGGVCLLAGIVVMIFGMLLPLLYVPLFVASLVLGIIGICKQRVGWGISILLGSVFAPVVISVLWFLLVIGGSALFLEKALEELTPSAASTPSSGQSARAGSRPAVSTVTQARSQSRAATSTTPLPHLPSPTLPPSRKQTSSPRTVSKPAVNTAGPPLALSHLVYSLKSSSEAHGKAKTSVQKSAQLAKGKALVSKTLGAGRKVQVSGVLQNIRREAAGIYVMTMDNVEGMGEKMRTGFPVIIRLSPKFRVKMADQTAAALNPGRRLVVIGIAGPRTGRRGKASIALCYKSHYSTVYTVEFASYNCFIGGNSYPSP